MKRIQDIEKLSAADLERIGSDESIPVPAGLQVRLPRSRTALRRSAAAAVVLFLGLGWAGYHRLTVPADTFDDPYLAYAAVEQAFSRMSGSINEAADKVAQAEVVIDKLNYWK